MARSIAWWSHGAASTIATRLWLREHPEAVIAYCDTGAEHPDNVRFKADVQRWFNRAITVLKSPDFDDTWHVWTRERYLAGINGAPCTRELKFRPRFAFQQPTDVHVFGYTADKTDVTRARKLRENYPELRIETPLIEAGLDKRACLALIEGAGIEIPAMYRLGFHNNNCIPCVKATSPAYWALIRQEFPEHFERMSRLSRELNVRLCRIKGERRFIDEIPADHPIINPISPACDFLCHEMAEEFEAAE